MQKSLALFIICWPLASLAAEALPEPESTNAKFQASYIWQTKPAFAAAYSGPASLSPLHETSYSITATAFLGWRAARHTELYFDPEVVQGKPFSGLTGLGGMPNGEQQKSSGSEPTLYRARLFVRHTIGLGGEQEAIESGQNQLADQVDKHRLVITAGNLAVVDVFDSNAVAHDGRSQFFNWALAVHGAYDFAADARGYTWGAALEYHVNDWVFRVGRFLQPRESNGLPLDRRIFRHYGDQIEIEHSHQLNGQAGKLRLLAFHNHAVMARFDDASQEAQTHGGEPDITRVRRENGKVGLGLNLEQNLSNDLATFARVSWNDGKTETYAFSEIDRSASAGLGLKGSSWQRPDDVFGAACLVNGLSGAHQRYLAAGGKGVFVGDGQIRYRRESIVELYYNLHLAPHWWLTLDYQHVNNPAYNADRGPVRFSALRLHSEY